MAAGAPMSGLAEGLRPARRARRRGRRRPGRGRGGARPPGAGVAGDLAGRGGEQGGEGEEGGEDAPERKRRKVQAQRTLPKASAQRKQVAICAICSAFFKYCPFYVLRQIFRPPSGCMASGYNV